MLQHDNQLFTGYTYQVLAALATGKNVCISRSANVFALNKTLRCAMPKCLLGLWTAYKQSLFR